MAYLSQSYKITGACPLLLNNGQLCNPLNDWTKALKKITSKRKMTETDHEEKARLEWYGGLYTASGLPCLPAENWERALLDAGRKLNLGKDVQAGTYCPDAATLIYDGPSEIDALWKDERFRLTNPVKIGKNRVMHTRPRFLEWSCMIEYRYEPSLINLGQLHQLLDIAQIQGIGDWRPKFGRFTAEAI
jgi:hypothetical protein